MWGIGRTPKSQPCQEADRNGSHLHVDEAQVTDEPNTNTPFGVTKEQHGIIDPAHCDITFARQCGMTPY